MSDPPSRGPAVAGEAGASGHGRVSGANYIDDLVNIHTELWEKDSVLE